MATPDTSRLPIALSLLRSPGWRYGAAAAVALSRKDAGLLAVLALDGACSRDALAQMLWPESEAAKARASLRQRRFRLLRCTGIRLIDGEEVLQLAQGVDHEFRDPDVRLACDAQALQGELLEGLNFDDCPEYARWLDAARERWRMARSQALGRLASRLQEQGSLVRAIEVAQRLCAEELLSEHAHRQLMELHYAHGDLGAALLVYQRLADRLEAELGELPDEETAALAARLRLGQGPVRMATVNAEGVPSTLRRPPRLIGREAAWAVLGQARATRTAVVVEGVPGMGKTRLLSDFIAACEVGAALLVTARAGDAQRPYALMVRLLSRLWLDADALRSGGQQELPEWARHELAALLPELGAGTPRTEALRLQRAVEVALKQAGLEVVALDDVQNADVATLELLASWVEAPGLPGWVLACRAGELPAPLQAWLKASGPPRTVVLQAFGAREVGELLRDLDLEGVEADKWADRLVRHTGGLPMFVLEMLRAMFERPSHDLRELPTPTGVADVVRGRHARLPEAARQLAHAAAVLRAPLTVQAGAALLGGQPEQWVEPYALLEAAQWLDARGVMHDLVSAVLCQAMPQVERRWLHGNVARWLMQAGRTGQEVAQHFDSAGLDEMAAEQFEAGARRAYRASRPPEEAHLWEAAALRWEQAGRLERAFEALRESITARTFASGVGAALQTAERMVAMARTPREWALARVSQGSMLTRLDRLDDATATLQEAWGIAETTGEPVALATAAAALAQVLSKKGLSDEALALLETARPHLGSCDLYTRAVFVGIQAFALYAASRPQECLAALAESMSLAEELADWKQVIVIAHNVMHTSILMGRLDNALAAFRKVSGIKEMLGPLKGDHFGIVETGCATVMLNTGSLGSAIAGFQSAAARFNRPGASLAWTLQAALGLVACHLARGDAAAAQGCLPDLPSDDSAPVGFRVQLRMLRAFVSAIDGYDPAPWLQQARELTLCNCPADVRLDLEAQASLLEPGGDDPWALLELEQQALNIRSGALATRLAWYQVDAMRRRGLVTEAAERAGELLGQPLWPTSLLPCHWLWIAHAAFEAAGDPRAPAVATRAREAHTQTMTDLRGLPGPPAKWPGPKSVFSRLSH